MHTHTHARRQPRHHLLQAALTVQRTRGETDLIVDWYQRVVRWEGARGALSVHQQLLRLAVNHMLLRQRSVVVIAPTRHPHEQREGGRDSRASILAMLCETS